MNIAKFLIGGHARVEGGCFCVCLCSWPSHRPPPCPRHTPFSSYLLRHMFSTSLFFFFCRAPKKKGGFFFFFFFFFPPPPPPPPRFYDFDQTEHWTGNELMWAAAHDQPELVRVGHRAKYVAGSTHKTWCRRNWHGVGPSKVRMHTGIRHFTGRPAKVPYKPPKYFWRAEATLKPRHMLVTPHSFSRPWLARLTCCRYFFFSSAKQRY